MSAEPVSVVGGTTRLAVIACVAALIVGAAWELTRAPIEANQHARRMAEFEAVLGSIEFDTLDYDAPVTIPPPHALPGQALVEIYPVRRNTRTVAWVFVVAADGYNGPIRLMIGLDESFGIIAVRVLSHSETPGLADHIERDRSDWITSFNNTEVDTDSDPRWDLKQHGGIFDSFTGASITPRAIVFAVRDTAAWAKRSEEQLQEASQ